MNYALRPFEYRILHLLASGYKNREIADKLGYTHGGTKYLVNQICQWLGVQSRTQAAVMALQAGMVDRAAVYAEIDRRWQA